MKKYKLLKRGSINVGLCTLYRIQALRNFGNVKANDLGGYVESERNLAHDGLAWVADEAKVYNGARIEGNAAVVDYAEVAGPTTISGQATISGWVRITSGGVISGQTHIYADAPDPGEPPPVRIRHSQSPSTYTP